MTYASTVLADTPVAYYRLDETSGTTLVDSSGNGRNGTYNSSPTFGAPALAGDGTAITLNGSSGDSVVPYASWMDHSGSFSLETWIKTTQSGYVPLLNRHDSAGAWQFRLYNGQLDFVRIAGGVVTYSKAGTLNDGAAHHIVLTYDAPTTTLRMYVDGTQVYTSSMTPMAAQTDPLRLGWSPGGAMRLNGTQDEVALYNYALPAARVAAHYSAATDLTGIKVSNLRIFELSGGGQASWSAVSSATSYEYRVNGGATASITGTSVTLTGLANGTSATLEVRPVNATTSGAWASITFVPNAPLVFDDFERADAAPSTTAVGTPVVGSAWTVPSGAVGISSGRAYVTGSAENILLQSGSSSSRDLYIRARRGATSTGEWAVIFRYRDTNNYWMVRSDGYVYRKIAGTFQPVFAAGLVPGFPANNTFGTVTDIAVLAYGDLIQIWLDGKLYTQLPDTESAASDYGYGLRIPSTSANVEWIHVGSGGDYVAANWSVAAAQQYAAYITATWSAIAAQLYKGRDTKTLDSGSEA